MTKNLAGGLIEDVTHSLNDLYSNVLDFAQESASSLDYLAGALVSYFALSIVSDWYRESLRRKRPKE